MKISLIITAGGTSSRYGSKNKLLEKVNNKSVIEHCVDKFLPITEISEIIISANESIIPVLHCFFKDNKNVKILKGGKTRQESVYNALKVVSKPDFVLIHDAARPLILTSDVIRLIEEVKNNNAVIMAVKTIDTIKKVDKSGKIISTVDRENLYNVQTPQAFKYSIILDAHEKLTGQNFTDDAGMLEALNYNVYIMEGNYSNFKITTKDDLLRMKSIIER